MPTKKIIILIALLSLLILPMTTNAAVPVVVFGKYLDDVYNVHDLWEIHENTQYELSLEKFLINLNNVFATRQEEFLKTFELAKIEKAREDVNKLNFETQRELTDQGVIVEVRDPVTGKPYTIKKEGRIITNPDDFLFEEPIQKARDFVYCYLAPWKHFAWEDDLQFCNELGLTGNLAGATIGMTGSDLCTSQNVCMKMPSQTPNGVTQCPSDVTRDKLKQRLLSGLVRKEHKWALAPPESWYSPAICERILNSFTCIDKENCFGIPMAGNKAKFCEFAEGGSCSIAPISALAVEEAAKVNSTHATLSRPVAYVNDNTIYELQQAAGNPNNDPRALERMLLQQTENIINQYQTLRQAQYTAGQGIRPEKYLVAFVDVKEGKIEGKPCPAKYYSFSEKKLIPGAGDCKALDEMFFGRPLTMNHGGEDKAYKDYVFWFDTENVTSPAVVLLQKMAAAAQAQFDLARMAYKDPTTAENITSDILYVANNSLTFFNPSVPIIKPNPIQLLGGKLPAPWEDPNEYANLPPEYFLDWTGEWPPTLGEGYYLNRWYKDINQMYLPKSGVGPGVPEYPGTTFDKILRQWFCLEGDWNCFEQRDPKYYSP